MVHLSEDMAYKQFPMISPAMAREFLLPSWRRGPGHTDHPGAANAEFGLRLLEIMVDCTAQFFRDFSRTPGPAVG